MHKTIKVNRAHVPIAMMVRLVLNEHHIVGAGHVVRRVGHRTGEIISPGCVRVSHGAVTVSLLL